MNVSSRQLLTLAPVGCPAFPPEGEGQDSGEGGEGSRVMRPMGQSRVV